MISILNYQASQSFRSFMRLYAYKWLQYIAVIYFVCCLGISFWSRNNEVSFTLNIAQITNCPSMPYIEGGIFDQVFIYHSRRFTLPTKSDIEYLNFIASDITWYSVNRTPATVKNSWFYIGSNNDGVGGNPRVSGYTLVVPVLFLCMSILALFYVLLFFLYQLLSASPLSRVYRYFRFRRV
jgi:hypothetical protein